MKEWAQIILSLVASGILAFVTHASGAEFAIMYLLMMLLTRSLFEDAP